MPPSEALCYEESCKLIGPLLKLREWKRRMKGAEANFTDLSSLARGYKLADGETEQNERGSESATGELEGKGHGKESALFRVKLFKIGGLLSLSHFAVAVGNEEEVMLHP